MGNLAVAIWLEAEFQLWRRPCVDLPPAPDEALTRYLFWGLRQCV